MVVGKVIATEVTVTELSVTGAICWWLQHPYLANAGRAERAGAPGAVRTVRSTSGFWHTRAMKFRGPLLQSGKTATGFEGPSDVVAGLGGGKKPAVTVTINGSYTYRSSLGSMGGTSMLPVSAEHRTGAGIAAGDEAEVNLELDDQPREVVVPDDLAAALDADPVAKSYFAGLSYSNQRRHVLAIEGAKAADTRARRVAKSVELFHEGRN
ncbi:MAG: YdeI/OmpD-associated family protein [Nakamurella sp.]